jgi:HSP20 family molecular chaperone IbpA
MENENVNNVGQSSRPEGDQTAQQSLEGSAKLHGDKLGDAVAAGASAGDGPNLGQGGVQSGQAGQGGGQGQPGQAVQGGGQQAASQDHRQERGNVGVLRPPVDVIEDAQGITLLADMPGVSKDNLNLRLDAQSLTIEGAMSLDLPQQLDSRYAEIRHQHYERTFALSRELDGEKATAELAHGVLKIRIPKTAHATPRKIPVNVASA